MVRPNILRVCHKFLIDEDGYDLELRELVMRSSKTHQNYVLFFLEKNQLASYCSKNHLKKRGIYYYHPKTGALILPISYQKIHGSYARDLSKPREAIRFPRIFLRAINSISPEIVCIHGTLLPQFLIAAFIAKRKNKKVWTYHNLGKINQSYIRHSLPLKFSKWLTHNLMPLVSDRLICSSELGKSSFLLKRMTEILPSIPPPDKNHGRLPKGFLEKNNLLKTHFKLNKGDLLFFCPSRYSEQKNQLRLVKAFIRFAEKEKRAKLILAGKCEDEHYLNDIKKAILSSSKANHFCLLPELPNKKIHQIYDISCCAVQVSINEGYGRVAAEALQHNLPVLAGKGGGYSGIIQDGKNGLLVNPLDEAEIYEGLNRITPLNLGII